MNSTNVPTQSQSTGSATAPSASVEASGAATSTSIPSTSATQNSAQTTPPKSNIPEESIIDFQWAHVLNTYDQLCRENSELPRVPHIQIDPETRTVHLTPREPMNASGKSTGQGSNKVVENLKTVTAVEDTKRPEVEQKAGEVNTGSAPVRSGSVRRGIVRKKLQ